MRYFSIAIASMLMLYTQTVQAQQLFEMPKDTRTGWASFENPLAEKGKAGLENNGAKGHAFDYIDAGATKVLLDIKGAGTIGRIWMTTQATPRMLRSLRIDMYWDDAKTPAVSVPLGDFFGLGAAKMAAFQNQLFASPEARSFNCFVPMPFKTAARITITNESNEFVRYLFYDIDFVRVNQQPDNMLYFHAHWNSNASTKVGEDFEILPLVKGKGRFLGSSLGIIADTVAYEDSWWGEGEVKMFLDDDATHPSLAGTGTEDYIGTGWGQGVFSNLYQGCPVADTKLHQWSFYRFHIPDPVYFYAQCKVTIQQIGGSFTEHVQQLIKHGAKLIPVSVDTEHGFVQLFDGKHPAGINDTAFAKAWTNFYRKDTYWATSYFYLDRPENNLKPLLSVEERVRNVVQ